MYMYACLHVSDGTWMDLLTSDGIMFDHVKSIPDGVTFISVMSKAYVLPWVYYGIVIHVIVEWGVFKCVWLGHTKNCIVLCELREYWFQCIVMYLYQIPCLNFMNKIWQEGIKQCDIFGRTSIFFRSIGSFQYGQAVLWEDGVTYLSLNHFIPVVVESFYHEYLWLNPHGVVNLCLPRGGCELW